jgi:hypothetical protein
MLSDNFLVQDKGWCRPAANSALRTCFSVLPDPVRGKAVAATKCRGTLYPAIRAAQ